MNFDAYLPVESYLLFRVVATHGVDTAGFTAASRELTNNDHVKSEPTYDPTRLTPDALRELFIYHIREEYADLTCPAGRPPPPQLPPIPHRELILDNFHKIIALVDRLWERYRSGILASIHQDERKYFDLQAEIEQLEKDERQALEPKAEAELVKQRAGPDAAKEKQVPLQDGIPSTETEPGRPPAQPPVQASTQPPAQPQPQPPSQGRPTPSRIQTPAPPQLPAQPQTAPSHAAVTTPLSTPSPVPTTAPPVAPSPAERPTHSPVPTPVPAATSTPGKPSPKPAQQTIPEALPVVSSAASFQPPSTAPPTQVPQAVPPPARPQHLPLKPTAAANGSASSPVLQPPVGAGQPPSRGLQSASPVPLPAVSPRPDASGKPRTPGPSAPAGPPPSAPTPTTLKWEKPYQPPAPSNAQAQVAARAAMATTHPASSAPATPQPQQPSQWYPQSTGQQPAQPHLQPHLQPQPQQQQQQQSQQQPPPLQPQSQIRPPPPPPPPQAQGQRPPSQPQQPVLAPPQAPSQLAAPGQAAPTKSAPDPGAIQPPQVRPASTTPVPRPVVPTAKVPAPQAQAQTPHVPTPTPSAQPRPIAAAPSPAPLTPTPAAAPPRQAALPQSQQKRPQQPILAPQYAQQQFTPSPLATQTQQPLAHPQRPDASRRPSSPYVNQLPRPALPPRLASQLASSSSPSQNTHTISGHAAPQTPASAPTPSFVLTGSGTRWAPNSTPSTPRPLAQGADVPSPAFESLSPVQVPAKLPAPSQTQPRSQVSTKMEAPQQKETKPSARRGRPPRSAQRDGVTSETPSRMPASMRRRSVASPLDELSMDDHHLTPHIKDEVVTPRRSEETGDTTADESMPSRRSTRPLATPSAGGMQSRMSQKRKRQSSSAELLPPAPPYTRQPQPSKLQPASRPTHVLWTRQFGRISSSALDQISSHRCANQFANPIRERDAPGYKSLILQPQDIKSIRAAMTHGNRAATEAAKNLEGGDPGTPTVWLPVSDELLPPRSIINSEQLERELVHMFSNAIMYNLDPYRGVGNSFLKSEAASAGQGQGQGQQPSTYRVDEDAVVRDSRIMFVEVERLLGDLRNAERDRSGLPPSANGSASGGGHGNGNGNGSAGSSVGVGVGVGVGAGVGANLRATAAAATTPTPRRPSTPAGQVVDDDVDELAGDGEGSVLKRRRIGTRA
ncbi:hypothetical protein SODALDRAFT_218731 [Sodiomyces alkalinus F11]|uniref:Bromo domain-containing protein n=1 Tax=Sodiomyces alkalinus (strain CBS 110278 / VKM F-3762 / F11) TaxID=1314773 RepID=A0A3N2PPL2_SODAK|nr:hypothetical protein SODALDRAFT_218731 [Sodiomyces alkalinus F11]ROT36394.1 hypothetical protein SODALDRAFT_218731 [Sodiomyces alkalinus F11]